MKTITTAVVAGLALMGSYLAVAQHEQHQGTPTAQAQKSPTMAMCKQMMADKESHLLHMKAMDSKLDGLVAKMQRAAGTNKVNATAAVVKELVAQRKSMHSMMNTMNTKMMGHMMQHMESGKMSDCPMMKGMMGAKG